MTRVEQITANLKEVRTQIDLATSAAGRSIDEITLIAVTKTYPASDVATLLELGINDFGENRDGEGAEKSSLLKARWHFQGQIQSNKIVSIAKWAQVIHSIDDPGHLARLDRAMPEGKKMEVFLQVRLDQSPGRGGVNPDNLDSLANSAMELANIDLQGLMAVAPLGEDPESAFARLAVIHTSFCQKFPSASALSAGMSGDFHSAIAYGATHIRVGSSILGDRSNPL